MTQGIKHIIFGLLVFSLLFGGDHCTANGANQVEVDGDRLSVRAEGMILDELLKVIEEMTGVRFWFDKSLAERKIFLDFRGVPLSEGIKKIVHPFNCASIYDETGKLRKMFILGRWEDSGMKAPWEERNNSAEGPKPGPSDSISFTPERDSNRSGASKDPPLRKKPVYFDGPPVDKAYSGSRPPNKQNKILEDLPVPVVGSSDHLPVPHSESAPSIVSAPNSEEIPEDVPVPLAGDFDHLPVPDYEDALMEISPGA